MVQNLSGKFVLRVPQDLHRTLKNRAARRGISLNELCVQALESYLAAGQADKTSRTNEKQRWFRVIKKLLDESLLGVILFGSTARGEARSTSDIDLLIVVSSDLPLNRRLYALWDEHLSEENYSPHFVHLPENIDSAGSIWYEAAVDGIVLYEKGRQLSRFLGRIRRKIVSGGVERRVAYGHPYWINSRGVVSDV
jgi:predicted nucleotidyltransferase